MIKIDCSRRSKDSLQKQENNCTVMKQLNNENRCYLCSMIYGIVGSLGLLFAVAIESLFINIIRAAILVIILAGIVINAVFLIRLGSANSIIKVIFRELKITIFSLTVALLLWLVLGEIVAFFVHIYRNIFDKSEIKEYM